MQIVSFVSIIMMRVTFLDGSHRMEFPEYTHRRVPADLAAGNRENLCVYAPRAHSAVPVGTLQPWVTL